METLRKCPSNPPHLPQCGAIRAKTAPQKQRQKIAWETPQPKETVVRSRSEAIKFVRAAVEFEAAKPDTPPRYRFGPQLWVVRYRELREVGSIQDRLYHCEAYSFEGKTVIGGVDI